MACSCNIFDICGCGLSLIQQHVGLLLFRTRKVHRNTVLNCNHNRHKSILYSRFLVQFPLQLSALLSNGRNGLEHGRFLGSDIILGVIYKCGLASAF